MQTDTTPAKPETKKASIARAVASGRAQVRKWLEAALAHGTIYYVIEHVSRSGMSRNISLATIIVDAKRGPELVRLWPHVGPEFNRVDWLSHKDALEAVARDMRFSFDKRCFRVGGCGMNMVFALVYDLSGLCMPRDDAAKVANGVRLEAF